MNAQLNKAVIFACYAVGFYCWLQIIGSLGVLILTGVKLHLQGY